MNPYLVIPLVLPGESKANRAEKEVKGKILPTHVIAYHEGYDGGTFLYLSNGAAMLTSWKVEEYEDMVKQYWDEIAKSMMKKSNLKILR